ncbi:MAG TPA: LLM class flavin-dependent oxidoreductase [Thermomicrobiales bacterium]|nr:LLM class flavin-dependent oxidoreductase [Thermomicrobiales bacterium]
MTSARRRELSIAFQSDKTPNEYRDLAALTESYGFAVMSIYGDLFFQPPIVPLTLAALATSRIRLGPASLNPRTLHPVEIAGQIATLDMVSNGRAYLGLSRGAWLEEIGLEQRRLLTRMREAIDVIEQLLRGERASYRGREFQLEEHHALKYRPLRQRVPLLIGSWGELLVGLAGERADEAKIGGSANPDVVPVAARWIASGAARASRDPADIGLVLGAVTMVDQDRGLARSLVRREMALYLPVVARLDPTVQIDPELTARMASLVNMGQSEAAGELIADELLDRFAFAGNPNDIIARCEALFAAGVTRIEFGTPHGVTAERGVRLLGERVLPALARWTR